MQIARKMAIGVDVSKRKPRRVRGTPSQVVRNRIAAAVISVGALCGIGWHFWPVSENIRKFSGEKLYHEPEGEAERREMIASFLPTRTPDNLWKTMQDEASPAKPYK